MIKPKFQIIALLIAAAAAFAASPLQAAEKSAASPAASAAPNKETADTKPSRFRGKIASADKTQKTLTIENKSMASRTFTVPDSAKLTKGADQAATWDDLTTGANVAGSYKKTADGKLEIVSLKIGAKEEDKSKNEKNAASPSSSPAGKSDMKSGEKK